MTYPAVEDEPTAVVVRDLAFAAATAKPLELGEYYASRTLLKLEVLPEHVADAVFVLTAGHLARTTGLIVPVDAGVAAAFLR